ncbi:MAG: hypothetical protein AB1831_06080 [Pseudomonadota bacterium]
MIFVWSVIAYFLSLVATNLIWLALPFVLSVLSDDPDPDKYATGQLTSYKIINFILGNAAGYWSITSANMFLKFVDVSSSIPIVIIATLLGVTLLPQWMRQINPYSKYGVFGEAFGLLSALAAISLK